MQSMDEIYQQYAKTVYKYLLSRTHREDLAEELTQETFCQAIRAIDRFDGKCKLSTWLCAIAKNVHLTYLRKHPALEDIDEVEIPVASAEESALDNLGKLQMIRMLHRLEEPYREVTYLRVFGELSFAEIGEVLGKTENWARVTFYRGKEKLRKEMSENETDHV
ncbi:MAG: sigma-70 family RNA polymerase sigma factor [Lachnospiraceae bacterium]|nr:sigma-70 family RNA polymerase sigma factor [Lachnospiraceae bacterium]MBP5263351.1 sigma-70 family RNA polymerase sigma factor [Lachnospiraceae bacterium]MBP5669949.1 sigma-70 family RNA polymerase sigma factor [Lachnospiraceae bacterium]MCR5500323.1 sigma-70 family RNA polymerase sigma factor [Acetatifactor sp.]